MVLPSTKLHSLETRHPVGRVVVISLLRPLWKGRREQRHFLYWLKLLWDRTASSTQVWVQNTTFIYSCYPNSNRDELKVKLEDLNGEKKCYHELPLYTLWHKLTPSSGAWVPSSCGKNLSVHITLCTVTGCSRGRQARCVSLMHLDRKP